MGTQAHGKMLKRIQVLDDGRVPAKEARSWRIEGQKTRITRKGHQRLLSKVEIEGFMSQKGLWNLVREKVLRERGALPKEEGDVIRKFKAMHEENFLSRWFREDGREKQGRILKWTRRTEKNGAKRGKGNERKKRTKRRLLKEDVTVLLPLNFCVKEELWKVKGDLAWIDL